MSKYDPEYAKAYYQRPEVKAKRKQYVQRDEVVSKKKAYWEEYGKKPEVKDKQKKNNGIPRYRFQQGKDSAKRRNLEWKLSLEEYAPFVLLPCHYCGQKLNPTGSGLDRKNNEPYYSLENVVPACGRCNATFIQTPKYEHKIILAKAIKEIDASSLNTTN